MSATDKVTEVVTETTADAAAEVARQAEAMEHFIRSMNQTKVKYGLLGYALGTAIGAFTAFTIAYRRAETKYSKIADTEISEMRQHYQAKILAAESQAQKLSPVKDIVSERGYAAPSVEGPPMAVQPPTGVGEIDDDSEMGADENTPDIEKFAPHTRNVFDDAPQVDHEWDYHEERRKRSPDIPYVIHYDERHEIDYQEVTLTYYSGDDVLCNEQDEVIDPDNRDNLVGDKNLDRFGHGSNDPSIVYIRNDRLELVYELVLSPNSYAEEVHGFSHEGYHRGNLERMRARERDEPET
jgi:hypothetical protein